MRHDPASGAIIIMLRSLKMHGMAVVPKARLRRDAVTDLMEQGAPGFDAAAPMLAPLPKAEVAEREVRPIAYHMKAARFPAYKDLFGFDFAASEINEATVRQLYSGEFMDGAQNAVLIRWLAGECAAIAEKRRPGHQQNACRDRSRHPGHRTSPQEGPLLLDHRISQCP